jgi:hypothetical protein
VGVTYTASAAAHLGDVGLASSSLGTEADIRATLNTFRIQAPAASRRGHDAAGDR